MIRLIEPDKEGLIYISQMNAKDKHRPFAYVSSKYN